MRTSHCLLKGSPGCDVLALVWALSLLKLSKPKPIGNVPMLP
jgi:hypothetical protein